MSMAPPLRFDRAEWSAAFADLGSFIPFVVAYVGVLKMDPVSILLAFGAALVGCGILFKQTGALGGMGLALFLAF